MLKIDDAGWGSMIGGVIIAVFDDDTSKYQSIEIPVEYFQGPKFTTKKYLFKGAELCFNLIQTHWPEYKGEILCCTGYCLDEIYTTLLANQYDITRGKITGLLQDKIETELLTNLKMAGLDIDYETLTEHYKKGLFWYKQIEWLKDGNPNGKANKEKIKLCKTGWRTFKAWQTLPYHEAKLEAQRIKRSSKRMRRNYAYLR